jgi:hypothetical protein
MFSKSNKSSQHPFTYQPAIIYFATQRVILIFIHNQLTKAFTKPVAFEIVQN